MRPGNQPFSPAGSRDLLCGDPERPGLIPSAYRGEEAVPVRCIVWFGGVTSQAARSPPVPGAKFAERQSLVFPAPQAGQAVFVEGVEVAELRHVILEQALTVGVDGADEHWAEPVEEGWSLGLGHAAGDTMLEREGA